MNNGENTFSLLADHINSFKHLLLSVNFVPLTVNGTGNSGGEQDQVPALTELTILEQHCPIEIYEPHVTLHMLVDTCFNL